MDKQAWIFGIVLALSTTGCAGFGLQQGSSLSAGLSQEQGLGPLWSSGERVPTGSLEAPLYADQELGALWNQGAKAPPALGKARFSQNRGLGSLWLSASTQSTILAQ